MTKIRNLFDLPATLTQHEFYERIAEGDLMIERIISTGQTTPVGEWFDQDRDEWVVLIQGEARILFENEEEIALKSGDYILIKAHEKHRVTYTSTTPACIWLAIYGNIRLTT